MILTVCLGGFENVIIGTTFGWPRWPGLAWPGLSCPAAPHRNTFRYEIILSRNVARSFDRFQFIKVL